MVPARREDGSGVMERVVPQILQGMEGFEPSENRTLLLMGATNLPWRLDPAVLRPGRFDEKIFVPLPDAPARRQILEMHLAHRPLEGSVDLDDLARRLDGYSGADVKYLCDRAAAIPFLQSIATGREGSITPEVITAALACVPPSVTGEIIRRFEQFHRGGG